MTPPKTRQELWWYISQAFGIQLPHKSFTPGHSSPFGFVADAFFNPGQDVAAWACRSGGKTLGASILAALEHRFLPGLQGRVLSGSEDQAKFLYDYWQNWCGRVLADCLDGPINRLLTKVNGGKFEILAASQKKVRGGKVHRLYRDEEDEIDPDLIGASLGMLDAPGHKARLIVTSTWHRPDGPMGRLVQDAEGQGIRLHKWSVWEALENCPKDRHQNGAGCVTCPLHEVCVGKAKQIDPRAKVGVASRASGLVKLDTAIRWIRQWCREQWDAEAECLRPSLTGLVYPQFDRRIHVKSGLDFSPDLPTYRTIDWGLRDFVCLWFQVDKQSRVYVVDEYWAQDAVLSQHAEYIKAKDRNCTIDATYCDPAGRNRNDQTGLSDIQVFKAHGIPCTYAQDGWSREVHNGIQLVRGLLRPMAGPPRLFVAPCCEQLVKAFEAYTLRKVNDVYVDEPLKPQDCDHPMDALRYGMLNRLAGRRGGVKQMGFA